MTIVRGKDRDGKIALYNLIDEEYEKRSKEEILYSYAIAVHSNVKEEKKENENEEKQIIQIISKPFKIANEISTLNNIEKILNKEENEKIEELKEKSNKILPEIREMMEKDVIEEVDVLDCYYDYFENLIYIIYYSPTRIDFRNVVKKFAKTYKARIEMKQINDKEYMANIGGVGECGRLLCCSQREELPNPTMKMVKMLGLNPKSTSVYGACGRIKCCVEYEYEAYMKAKEELPKVGERITYNEKDAKIIKVDVITKNITLELKDEDGSNIKVVNVEELLYNPKEEDKPNEDKKSNKTNKKNKSKSKDKDKNKEDKTNVKNTSNKNKKKNNNNNNKKKKARKKRDNKTKRKNTSTNKSKSENNSDK